MAFFAESTYEESYQDLGIKVNDYTDFDMLALEACNTVQEMDNAIMQGIGRYELTQVREGAEVVYTEGMMNTIKSKIEKIWNFIKNWVKNVWNKFIGWLESYVRGDKAFLTKYKKKLDENLAYLDKDYEKTFKYAKIIKDGIESSFKELEQAGSAISSKATTGRNSVKSAGDKTSEEASKVLEEIDDEIDNAKEKFKDAEFEEEVNAGWIKSNFAKIIDMIGTDVSKVKRQYDKNFKALEKEANDNIKAISDAGKDMDQPGKSNHNAYVNFMKSVASKSSKYHTWVSSYEIKAIKGAKSDARAMARAILTAKPNPKYNESAFDHNDFEAYFNI